MRHELRPWRQMSQRFRALVSMLEASEYVALLERRQNLKICCPEEIALRLGCIAAHELAPWLVELGIGTYADHVRRVVESL